MRFFLLFASVLLSVCAFAQTPDVTYLESVGKGNTRVFSVSVPVKQETVTVLTDKGKLKPDENACFKLIKTLLFDGVENYNQGRPLVDDQNNRYALSLLNPKDKPFLIYCKEKALENSENNPTVYHVIIELNQFTLLKNLKSRGAMTTEFED